MFMNEYFKPNDLKALKFDYSTIKGKAALGPAMSRVKDYCSTYDYEYELLYIQELLGQNCILNTSNYMLDRDFIYESLAYALSEEFQHGKQKKIEQAKGKPVVIDMWEDLCQQYDYTIVSNEESLSWTCGYYENDPLENHSNSWREYIVRFNRFYEALAKALLEGKELYLPKFGRFYSKANDDGTFRLEFQVSAEGLERLLYFHSVPKTFIQEHCIPKDEEESLTDWLIDADIPEGFPFNMMLLANFGTKVLEFGPIGKFVNEELGEFVKDGRTFRFRFPVFYPSPMFRHFKKQKGR